MLIDKAYYVGTNPYSFRVGIPAEIIGVQIITPDNQTRPRPCYHVRWSDSTEDWVCIADDKNYKIISFTDILNGNIPKEN